MVAAANKRYNEQQEELMPPKSQNINLTFSDGSVSKIDEDVQKLIVGLQKELNLTKLRLPFFWDLSTNIKGYSEHLLDFYCHTLKHRNISTS